MNLSICGLTIVIGMFFSICSERSECKSYSQEF